MWDEEHKFQIWILKTLLKYNRSKPSVYLFFYQYCTWLFKDKEVSCKQGDIRYHTDGDIRNLSLKYTKEIAVLNNHDLDFCCLANAINSSYQGK